MQQNSVVMPPLLLALWVVSLALAWLLPNHYLPWTTFHSDAWMAFSLWVGMVAVLFKAREQLRWNKFSVALLLLIFVPWMQWWSGQIYFYGQAWISSIYIMGFMFAIHCGQYWEVLEPGKVVHAIFAAIGLAALASVGLQLHTWFGLQSEDLTDIVSMGLVGNRLYANIGQPNILASLLLWGLLATLVFYQDSLIRGWSAGLVAVFLIAGLVFTQSRTGTLSLTVLLIVVCIWRKHWKSPYVVASALVLYGLYWLLPHYLADIHQLVFMDGSESYSRSIQMADTRLTAWRLFASAVLKRPWFGYGVGAVADAQVELSTEFPPLGIIFGHTHNQFLDFIIWFGLPIGLALVVVLIEWVITAWKRVKDARGMVCLMALMVMGVHSMLEFPMQHAFFLLPAGLFIGVVNVRASNEGNVRSNLWTLASIWLAVGVALFVTIADYMRSEESFYALRFEKARIGVDKTGIGRPPDVLVLTQLRDWIWADRLPIQKGMPRDQLEILDAIASNKPTGWTIYRIAKASAISAELDRAQYWIDRICILAPGDQCNLLYDIWIADKVKYPEMDRIRWPNQDLKK